MPPNTPRNTRGDVPDWTQQWDDQWEDPDGCVCDDHDVLAAAACPLHAEHVTPEPPGMWIRDAACLLAFVVSVIALLWAWEIFR